jgi:hypothetical protein
VKDCYFQLTFECLRSSGQINIVEIYVLVILRVLIPTAHINNSFRRIEDYITTSFVKGGFSLKLYDLYMSIRSIVNPFLKFTCAPGDVTGTCHYVRNCSTRTCVCVCGGGGRGRCCDRDLSEDFCHYIDK